ncbi:MAG: hypothetical protein ACXVI3_03100 [Halobacteriota archaeon]
MRADTALLAAAVIGSLVLTVTLIALFHVPFLFIFFPIVPFLFRRQHAPPIKRCTSCAWYSSDLRHRYCPCDGTPLVTDPPSEEA